ncbi:MAG: hypothetical protein MUC48_04950 [Leptolyngbya sp. Prado105]|jgi:hypothetical protein|nr:hypothetical protein [Leptolyngbya sp. Prado105]
MSSYQPQNLILQAHQIVAMHDARIFTFKCAAKAFQQGLYKAGAALYRAVSQWEDESARLLVIQCLTREDAKTLRENYKFLASEVLASGMRALLLTWNGANQMAWHISASLAQDNDPLKMPYPTGLSEIEVLKLAERLILSDRPQSLVLMEGDWQIWTNEAMNRLLQVSAAEARSRNLRELWFEQGDDGLDRMKRLLTQQSVLSTYSYVTQLNPGERASFVSDFELVLEGRFRLATNLECTPVVAVV